MDPSLPIKLFFTLGATISLSGNLIPSFRSHIMNYGPRKSTTPVQDQDSKSNIKKPFNFIASLQVPHTWFMHYYIVSVASSIFWAWQITTQGRVVQILGSWSRSENENGEMRSMSVNQVVLGWGFMAFQGGRRLLESITLTKPSQSRMWVGLWIVGMLYYVFIGIGVWIEGISVVNQGDVLSQLQFSRPSARTSIAMTIFCFASIAQNICHKHLASLKKYSLPDHPFFRALICPHYACECLIYLAMAIQSAPAGQLLNGTVLTGLLFVASNLAVTADSTREWYSGKFGEEAIKGRWRMVPHVF